MAETIKITELFGANLAQILADKIITVEPGFDSKGFIKAVDTATQGLTYTKRIEVIADKLHDFLPSGYPKAVAILLAILGDENSQETGMFTNYYWIMPIGNFVQRYGLDYFDISMAAIEEITKRNTGEYAVRPYIRADPVRALARMKQWASSGNFHLRRLASEGLRPKLPWAPKLDTFIEKPEPVFEILTILKADDRRFVQKSVANHITDYLKVNPVKAWELISAWQDSDSPSTQWILKHATRNHPHPEHSR
jgi:3-methyladenine DNA glycosylase AlkC